MGSCGHPTRGLFHVTWLIRYLAYETELDLNITLDGCTLISDAKCIVLIDGNKFNNLKNAAGYYLGPVVRPCADGA